MKEFKDFLIVFFQFNVIEPGCIFNNQPNVFILDCQGFQLSKFPEFWKQEGRSLHWTFVFEGSVNPLKNALTFELAIDLKDLVELIIKPRFAKLISTR